MLDRSRLNVFVLGVLLTLGVMASGASSAPAYRPDVVILKLKPHVALAAGRTQGSTLTGVPSLDDLNSRLRAVDFRRTVPTAQKPPFGFDRHGLSDYYTVELPQGTDLEKALAEYAADPNVEVAEPDYIMPLHATTPNDPMYDDQWTHHQDSDVDIDTDEAWDLETGDSTVIIGICDSGILYGHEDLEASMWVNPGEDLDGDGEVWDLDDIDSVDNDGNGFVDDLVGWDFFGPSGGCWPGEDCDGPDNDPVDFTGHGTHVGGIVAATTDNGLGVAGVAGGMRSARKPGVKLMGVRCGYLADDGIGYVHMSACAAAFDYAVANGASVLNGSWGTSGTLIQTAGANAIAAGVVITYSAGNENVEFPIPALAMVDGVITVASLNRFNRKAPSSSYGTWVDISAPGVDILNTYGQFGIESYAELGGTSMAAPTVAGVAALLKSHHSWFTTTEIETLLTNNVDDVYADNPTYIDKLGSGRVNAYKALSGLTTADFDVDVTFGRAPLLVNFTDVSPNAPSGPYLYEFGDGGEETTADAVYTYLEPGVFTVSFTASGPSGPHTRTCPDLIVVVEDTVQYESIQLAVTNGSTAAVPVRMRNTHTIDEFTLPFKLTGPPKIFLDSLTLGPRTTGWTAQLVFDNRFNGEIAFRLTPGGTSGLTAGEGVVAHLWVRSGPGNSPGQVETVDSARLSSHYLRFSSQWADFTPDFVSGTITIFNPCICPYQSDFDEDLFITALDLSAHIDILFGGDPDIQDPSCPVPRGDLDCDGFSTALDMSALIDHLFSGGPGPCDPCAP